MQSAIPRHKPLPYRPDIDGLRALSIIVVVFYHAGVPYFGGGFVGVDVFFVISGYLITSIILTEMGQGTFALTAFYERRARRLMPTLSIVLLATFVASLVIMTPYDLMLVGKSMFYTLILSANLYFADQTGYFSPAMEHAPLLHIWSLAVEEQFYIVWPLVLIAILRYARRWAVAAAAVLLLVSFAANIVVLEEKPVAAFFYPHTRAWQLLAGSILAFGVPGLGRAARELLALAGLALIVGSVVWIDSSLAYPGYFAIAPTLGAVCLIWAGQSELSSVGKVLRLAPLVFVGLVSYAWYLWHWPMIALFRYELERAPEGAEIAALVLASFALAVLSWAYLENPVRRGAWWKSRPRTIAATALASMGLLALSGATFATNGFMGRFPEEIAKLNQADLASRPGKGTCRRQTPKALARGELCYLAKSDGEGPSILLWGDSHSGVLTKVFSDLGRETGSTVVYVGTAACPPIIGAGRKRRLGHTKEACRDINDAVGKLMKRHKFSDIVLAARWTYYMSGTKGDGTAERTQHYLQDDAVVAGSLSQNKEVLAAGLRRSIEAVVKRGARVWVVMEAPYIGRDVPNHLARKIIRGLPHETSYGPSVADYKARGKVMEDMLADLPVRTIDPTEALCEAERCLAVAGGKPLYFDDDHLSIHGADRLKPLLEEVVMASRTLSVRGGTKSHRP